MKYHKMKWIRDRLYEVYINLGRNGLIFAMVIADVDLLIQVTVYNLRDVKEAY